MRNTAPRRGTVSQEALEGSEKPARSPKEPCRSRNPPFSLRGSPEKPPQASWGRNSKNRGGHVRGVPRKCPGSVPGVSRECPGSVPGVSRECPGSVPECPGSRGGALGAQGGGDARKLDKNRAPAAVSSMNLGPRCASAAKALIFVTGAGKGTQTLHVLTIRKDSHFPLRPRT